MGHKEGHGAPHSPGTPGSTHRGGPLGGEHHPTRPTDVEALGGAPGAEATEGNTDTLWIDLGGEG
ncbi:hypothetical protein AYO44_07860 [Planctomycetaceae bacterium SCGC AG-212-F19]|nr:hypothetical protein AYO44_07860 [Planctomycetaceae bacterium SCGC AG-212-F19]